MTDKQIQERLLIAALTEDMPSAFSARTHRLVWRYAAAAVIAVLLALPIVLHRPQHQANTCSNEEIAQELAMAFSEVNNHLTMQDHDLLNF